ncbi:DUF58 domain-containing protein [Actinokineospora inagensis]|uniref:DUF58 domain-containing protein n=1 Tax=Actinokineospora inagensis TaxID=103730 RepID=UPI000687A9D1|nr:DUF58 domain-containing protein [Actinokineospora inagensis]
MTGFGQSDGGGPGGPGPVAPVRQISEVGQVEPSGPLGPGNPAPVQQISAVGQVGPVGPGLPVRPVQPQRPATGRPTALDRVVEALRAVTPMGVVVLVCSVLSWIAGGVLGWQELVVAGAAGVLAFLVCLSWAVGRNLLAVRFNLDKERVVAGQPATCVVEVAGKRAGGRLLAMELELAVDDEVHVVEVPGLVSGQVHSEFFPIPTERRGVVAVGPAVTVRGDPLGMLRRAVEWGGTRELFVHPVTVPLGPLGAGMLRDLEGYTTTDLSTSDLAFHTLREFAPGDDRRHIHWRSSAKVAAAGSAGGTFLVRQYLDTRRARLVIAVDGDAAAYADLDDFETAVSVAGSLALRALEDDIDLTVFAAGQAVHDATVQSALDGLARVTPVTMGLDDLTTRAARLAPDATVVVVVAGGSRTFPELLRACGQFPSDIRRAAITVAAGGTAGITENVGLTVATVRDLDDLRAVLAGGPLA